MADVERQFDWYRDKEAMELAERYLRAVEASCTFLSDILLSAPRFAVSRLGFRNGVSLSFFISSMRIRAYEITKFHQTLKAVAASQVDRSGSSSRLGQRP